MSDFQLRSGEATDVSFVQDSWKKSYRQGCLSAQRVPGPVFYPMHADVISRILGRAVLLVACATEAPAQILGWACFEVVAGKACLHYVYVKQPFRGMGLARALLAPAGVHGGWCSHLTDAHGVRLARSLSLVFNPYLLGVVP